MKTVLSNDKNVLTLEEAKANFLRNGETVSDWARQYGFYPQQVSAVLSGKCKGMRGRAHEIAVRLGVKDGVIKGDR